MSSPAATVLQQISPPRRLGAEPLRQSGAYAVIEDGKGRVLTVQAENGRFYLPGGRMEPGETPSQALLREITEECGWSAALLAPLSSASQAIMGGAVDLRTSHWRARLVDRLDTDPEHRLAWMIPDEALAYLHRECDRAALWAARAAA